MSENQLFALALGLSEPWVVEAIDFSVEQNQLNITLDFHKGSQLPCPECGKSCAVHDTSLRTWRHLNFFQHETYLHARQPRIKCPDHNVKTVDVPWARSGAGFTLLFEALVMILAQNGMTPTAIGRLVGEYDTLIWRVLHHYVDEARKEVDMSQVKQVGMDETSSRKGHKYVTTFVDMETHALLFATEGKDANTVSTFKSDLEEHKGKAEQVTEFCIDMSPAFQKGIKEEFPEAYLTFDNFHLTKLMNKAVDQVRRDEQKEKPELKGSRYLWLKNEWNHSKRQKDLFHKLRHLNLKTNKAHHLKGVFQDIFSCDPEDGESLLKKWYFWATHSRMEPIIQFAKTVKAHWDGVLRWFTSKINNGILEGLNSLIQSAKRRSRGFRNIKNFIVMIYLVGAKLKFKLPNVLPATHSK